MKFLLIIKWKNNEEKIDKCLTREQYSFCFHSKIYYDCIWCEICYKSDRDKCLSILNKWSDRMGEWAERKLQNETRKKIKIKSNQLIELYNQNKNILKKFVTICKYVDIRILVRYFVFESVRMCCIVCWILIITHHSNELNWIVYNHFLIFLSTFINCYRLKITGIHTQAHNKREWVSESDLRLISFHFSLVNTMYVYIDLSNCAPASAKVCVSVWICYCVLIIIRCIIANYSRF